MRRVFVFARFGATALLPLACAGGSTGEGESEAEAEGDGDGGAGDGGCCEDRGPCFFGQCGDDGGCDYLIIEHALCDDADLCTQDDTCGADGECVGAAYSCDAPPPPDCADAATVRTYAAGECNGTDCDFPSEDTPCPSACVAGACCAIAVLADEVAASGASGAPSLAFSAAGDPRVAYQSNEATHVLRYAAWNGATSSWAVEVADTEYDSEFRPALAIPADTIANVVYLRDGLLRHARRTGPGAVWSSSPVDSAADLGAPSLALAAGGDDLEAAYDAPGIDPCREVRHAAWIAGEWTVETIAECGSAPSVAAGADGTVHVAFVDGGIRYAARPPDGDWGFWDVADDAAAAFPSLAVGDDGVARVAWQSGEDATYAQGTAATGFASEAVAAGSLPRLAVDASGGIHAVWGDGAAVVYARRAAKGAWATAEAGDGVSFEGAAIAVDPDGMPRLAWVAGSAVMHAVVALECE